MHAQNKNIMSGWVKTLFLYGVIGFMAYTTWHAVYLATNNKILATLSLFLFDGGAYAGYKMLVGDAEGAPQRSAAQIVLWADFALAAAMVAGALEILPANTIKYVMLASAAFNGWALYYYETHQPETIEQMLEQDEADDLAEAARRNRRKLHREAMRQADGNISRQAVQLGTLLSLRATSMLKYEMRLPMTQDEQAVFEGEIIDTNALPAPVETSSAPTMGLLEYLKTFFTQGQRNMRYALPSKQEDHSGSSNDQDDPQI
jgi:hypothetical protein